MTNNIKRLLFFMIPSIALLSAPQVSAHQELGDDGVPPPHSTDAQNTKQTRSPMPQNTGGTSTKATNGESNTITGAGVNGNTTRDQNGQVHQ